MKTYYNEFDPKAAAWLRVLANDLLISPGVVDERSIKEVDPKDVMGYRRCHYFAGIGGWEHALELAGWPRGVPVWTGSCPCQPYSNAGKGLGDADERNLWPSFFNLIRQCRPQFVFGEQVASDHVVGKVVGADENLQYMQDREAVFGVFRELQRESPKELPVMPRKGKKTKKKKSQKNIAAFQGLEAEEPRACSDVPSKEQSQDTGDGFQFGSKEHTRENRRGFLRNDRDSVLPEQSEVMGCPIVRSDRFEDGLYDGQRPSGSVCPECNVEHMGSESYCGNCLEDYGEKSEGFRRFVGDAREESSSIDSQVWLDGIRSDLEKEGYTVWACVLGAHSAGTDHIRQRLYWVAYDNGRRFLGWNAGCEADSKEFSFAEKFSSSSPFAISDAVMHSRLSEEPRSIVGGLSTTDGADLVRMGDDDIAGRDSRQHGAEAARYGSSIRSDGGFGRFWGDYDIIHFKDGKTRRIESGTFPLVDGLPRGVVCGGDQSGPINAKASSEGRQVRLKGYGNAIVPQVAAMFVRSFMDYLDVKTQNDREGVA